MAETTLTSYIIGNNTSLYRHEYTPLDAVNSFHALPRFSHNADFSALFSSDPEEVKGYTSGILFLACLLMSFFTVWGCLILLFKCLGPKHLGVFSGFPHPHDGCSAKTGRIVFGTSAVIVMVFSTLAVTQGLTQLQYTTDTVDATNQDVVKIHSELTGISSNLKRVSREATPVRDQMVEFLQKDICPLQPNTALEAQLRSMGDDTLVAMEELADFIADGLQNIDGALRQADKATDSVNEVVQQVQFTTGAAVGVMLPYFVVPALLLVTLALGVTETYWEAYYFFTTWFVLPLFVLMVMFAFVVCAFFVLATESNADFCAGGGSPTMPTPEGTIQNILGQYDLTAGNFYHDAVMFYAHQCTINAPWGFLEDYYRDLTTAQTTLTTLAETIVQVSPDRLSQECGVDFAPAFQLITQLQVYTSVLSATTKRSMELMSCSSIVPLYTNVVYEATCEYSVTAAIWLFSCALVISFFGMLMIMFRGAYYPFYLWEGKDDYSTASSGMDLEEDDDDDDDYIIDESTLNSTLNTDVYAMEVEEGDDNENMDDDTNAVELEDMDGSTVDEDILYTSTSSVEDESLPRRKH